jgi:hypothetical protein
MTLAAAGLGVHIGMLALIVAEIGGFAVIFAGFVSAQLR